MTKDIAIIGAGIAGLALALCLDAVGIDCAIYESRDAPLNIGGAVMLSPNALKILDALGVYKEIESNSFGFDILYFRTVTGELKDTYKFGSMEEYGYGGFRPYRYQLINILLEKIRSRNIPLHFGRKFSRIVKETDDQVTWQFADGSTSTASMLVGADGIHSRVREYLFPDLEPKFIGIAGITASIPAAQLRLPSPEYQLPVTITKPGIGAFVIAPQGPDGSEVFFGRLKRMSEPTRQGWDKIHADKECSIAFLKENASAFGDIAVSATENIPADTVNVWPFYIIPRLASWASERKRVVLVGDGAHAIPPSSGQGINQALEDVFMLSLLLGQGKDGVEDLQFWQTFRQQRVDRVLELNAKIDRRRMPQLDDAEVGEGDEKFELGWLYGVDIQEEVDRWVRGAGKQ